MRPSHLQNHCDIVFNCSQVDPNHLMVSGAGSLCVCVCVFFPSLGYQLIFVLAFQARVPYPYNDPFFGGSLAAYGPQATVSSFEYIFMRALDI